MPGDENPDRSTSGTYPKVEASQEIARNSSLSTGDMILSAMREQEIRATAQFKAIQSDVHDIKLDTASTGHNIAKLQEDFEGVQSTVAKMKISIEGVPSDEKDGLLQRTRRLEQKFELLDNQHNQNYARFKGLQTDLAAHKAESVATKLTQTADMNALRLEVKPMVDATKKAGVFRDKVLWLAVAGFLAAVGKILWDIFLAGVTIQGG